MLSHNQKALTLIVTIVGLFLAFWFLAISNTPSAQDHDEAFAVAAKINYPFRPYNPDSTAHQPSIYVKPGAHRTTLIIYGITNNQEQENLLLQIKLAHLIAPNKTIRVEFMDKENWVQVTEVMKARGHEKSLRTEVIK